VAIAPGFGPTTGVAGPRHRPESGAVSASLLSRDQADALTQRERGEPADYPRSFAPMRAAAPADTMPWRWPGEGEVVGVHAVHLWQCACMRTGVNTLHLVPAVRPAELLGRHVRRSRREYLDFTIDGVGLNGAIGRRGGATVAAGLVSILVTDWPHGFPIQDVLVLLGERTSELPDGRVPIYVCPECGDLGCGAVTVSIDHGADVVTWADFGWQTDYDEDVDRGSYTDLGPYHFEGRIFDSVLRKLLP
jgi:hypothetical protein